jgi:hypothetical protein
MKRVHGRSAAGVSRVCKPVRSWVAADEATIYAGRDSAVRPSPASVRGQLCESYARVVGLDRLQADSGVVSCTARRPPHLGGVGGFLVGGGSRGGGKGRRCMVLTSVQGWPILCVPFHWESKDASRLWTVRGGDQDVGAPWCAHRQRAVEWLGGGVLVEGDRTGYGWPR